jgi:hypothetical protein
MKNVSQLELLAMLTYSDLKQGQVVIKLEDSYVIGNITDISINVTFQDLPEFKISGYIPKQK